jgi:cysteine desulfurase
LGEAAVLAKDHLAEENSRVRALRDRLERKHPANLAPQHGQRDREHRLPNTSSISFEYVEGEAILLRLSNLASAPPPAPPAPRVPLEPSHVLRAMGVPFTAAHGSIRFSSAFTTPSRRSTTLRSTCRPLSPSCWNSPRSGMAMARLNGPADGNRLLFPPAPGGSCRTTS